MMPRKSAAALAVAPLPRTGIEPRLNPPAGLSDPHRTLWRETVNAMPGRWFGQEQAPLLERYVRHLVRARDLEILLGETDPRADFELYAKLSDLSGRETTRALTVARSLRLTLASRLKAETAHNIAASIPRSAGPSRDEWRAYFAAQKERGNDDQ